MYKRQPFDIKELLLTIKNLLKYKDSLRRYFSTPGIQQQELPDQPFLSGDYIFLNKLNTLLETEINNPNLNVDNIATRLGFSRSVFYRRIKTLTNIAPNDFIRTYRLKRAAEMITFTTFSLSEISDRTGFSSYSYFSKAFKKHFGVSPKDYHSPQASDSSTSYSEKTDV